MGGQIETFKDHISTYHPGFKFDEQNPDAQQVMVNAILGDHLDFCQMLIDE